MQHASAAIWNSFPYQLDPLKNLIFASLQLNGVEPRGLGISVAETMCLSCWVWSQWGRGKVDGSYYL